MKNRVYLKKFFKSIIILTLSVFLFYTFGYISDKKNVLANIKNNKQNVEVFKTPSCGCCYGYVLFLEKEKFNVKETDMRSLHSIKQKYNIPHVPLEAVNKLLKEQPDIDGIALPGMPIGTPGMPGKKEEPFVVYQLIDGKFSIFMTI